MADEFIDILDKTGKPTGEIRLKSEAHALGLYHASVHIWFYTLDRKVLFQKRAHNKDTFPGLWDVSVAGHIGTGESAIDSAIREVEEEIGLFITFKDLEFIGKYLAEKQPAEGLFDNEYHYIYISQLSTPITSLQLQEEEVAEITLIDLDLAQNILQHKERSAAYVPHDAKYYDFIFKEIKYKLP